MILVIIRNRNIPKSNFIPTSCRRKKDNMTNLEKYLAEKECYEYAIQEEKRMRKENLKTGLLTLSVIVTLIVLIALLYI